MPSIDLHGMDRVLARIKTNEFLNDHFQSGDLEVAIIHGIGTGVLKNEVHTILYRHPLVDDFHLDYFNSGCTLVRLKKKY